MAARRDSCARILATMLTRRSLLAGTLAVVTAPLATEAQRRKGPRLCFLTFDPGSNSSCSGAPTSSRDFRR